MIVPSEVAYPFGLERRIARRAIACARRLGQMRRDRMCDPDALIWPELRQESHGTVTNVRFRIGQHSDAVEIDTTAPEARIAGALGWHARECFFLRTIRQEKKDRAIFTASDDDLSVILDVVALNPLMSAWRRLVEAEWDARLHESNHRTMVRHMERRVWLEERERED